MTTKALACSLAALAAFHTALLAQGPLTPPGAPAPTMKTLDQLEARTPISSAPIAISTRGSYYLTGNLTVSSGDAIFINTDDVTLDLNGFTISSTANPASGSAVVFTNIRRNVTIRNGHIRGTTTFAAGTFTTGGFLEGIDQSFTATTNVRVSDIDVLGVANDGIDLGTNDVPTFIVERCTVSVCGGYGIRASLVRDCAVRTAGGTAIEASIASHCTGESVGATALGIGVSSLAIVENCRGIGVGGYGVVGTLVSNSVGISTSGAAGIQAPGGTVSFSNGQRNGGTAIFAVNAIGCTVTGTGTVTATNKSLGTP